MIFGQSRSGSTLLVELMRNHPRVHCDGELLNFEAGYIRHRLLLKAIRRCPLPYFAYMKRKASSPVYGFKLLLNQLRHARQNLKAMHLLGWKFIRVRRRNIVHQALSGVIAKKTRRWHRRDDDDSPETILTISREELRAGLALREAWRRREAALIADIEHLDLVYEDDLELESNWPAAAERTATYLEIEPFDPQHVSVKRIAVLPYRERIANYLELEDYLVDLGYRAYLTEPQHLR